ncbi:MAG TPA: hypothetical protein VLA09_12670 [Longimicrobiales bacterium]|nr:hypothetical protein [Longimicrobiales bacterium]
MRSRSYFPAAGLLAAGLVTLAAAPIGAQQWEEKIPGNAGEWNVRALRPSGQPVIPTFDGWVLEEDGTATLCAGYFNLNLDEALEIPIGPNNYIEPAEYNGIQPTYFNPVPTQARNKLKHYCVFTINVPVGGDDRIVWHLRRSYDQDFSVPLHSGSEYYRIDDLFFPTDRAERGGSIAPIVRFVAPEGPTGIGKGQRGNIRVGPVSARVGQPLTLTLEVTQPLVEDYEELTGFSGEPRSFQVFWSKYSGPPGVLGIVTFSNNEFMVGPTQGLGTTTATFTEPGEYVLITQVLGGGFDNQCCWTNGYVEVNVTR